jgi:NhaA family Na+:H+ antiporter
MVVPALIFFGITATDAGARDGWAIPMATDIAFALAVLAVVGSHLPPALRAFLLTLAVVDDLGAIAVIALFFTDDLSVIPLIVSIVLMVGYFLLQRARVVSPWIYVPLALTIWTLVHASGIHATVAGIALGLLTRVKPDPGEGASPAERLEHRVRPLSAGVAVPLFAFLAAGVSLTFAQLADRLDEPLFVGVVAGLVVGKLVGVFGGTWLTARFTRAQLDPSLRWIDIVGVSLVAGVGFTVSLLIAELAFGEDAARLDASKAAIFVGSLIAAAIAAIILRLRDRAYRAANGGTTPVRGMSDRGDT